MKHPQNRKLRGLQTLRSQTLRGLLAAGTVLLAPAAQPRAHACGGFWCSNTAPVNQTAEQIIFVDNADETVSTIIQIQYQGPSEKFAWLIPIPGDPDIAISSNTVFQLLEGNTAPQYELERDIEGTCKPGGAFFPGGYADGGLAVPDSNEEESGIMVVSRGQTGPYEHTTISVDPGLSDPAGAAIAWFEQEGYDLSGIDSELLGPYLADGLNLLAFKLTKDAQMQSGAIRPVILTYESELPSIPIRPTAVAAQNDMGIRVWVLAEQQAIPKNYKSLVINDALINWFYYRDTYDEVVTAAADEAQGQGFVTELATAQGANATSLFTDNDETNWTMLTQASYPDPIDAIWAANNYYRDWDGWRDAIEASVMLPDGTNLDDFARDPDSYRGIAVIDVDQFFNELAEKVVEPMRKSAQLLASRPYLTRLYSTMSAEEMTLDPVFAYNADLAEVSNVHTAKLTIQCSADLYEYEAPWRIQLPQGGVVRGEGQDWPFEVGALPANLKIVQLSTKGSGAIVRDNSSAIGDSLADAAGEMPTGEMIPDPPKDGVIIGGEQTVDMSGGKGPGAGPDKDIDAGTPAKAAESDSDDCRTVSGQAASSAWWSLASTLLALGWVRYRRHT